jgi:hypothetical protein
MIPKIRVSSDKFEFKVTTPKQLSKLKFTVSNLNDRKITVKFEAASQFHFEGDCEIKAQ